MHLGWWYTSSRIIIVVIEVILRANSHDVIVATSVYKAFGILSKIGEVKNANLCNSFRCQYWKK